MTTIPLAIQAYQSQSLDHSAQRVVNFYAETSPKNAKSFVPIFGTPGIKSFATPGNGPIRGMHVMDDLLYVVSGTELISVSSSATEVDLGDIDGSGRVGMADNGTELVIVNGTQGWTYDTSNGLVEITDTDFLNCSTVTFQDGYFIFERAGTGSFFISAINDGTSYATLDIATAASAPDDTIAVLSDHRELFLFGDDSIEVWINTGATFPFERMEGGSIERGCAAKYSPAKEDNSVFFLGDNLKVYRISQYVPEEISTFAVADKISGYTTTNDASGYCYSQQGHTFYVLTFPTEKVTWVYDINTSLWHERESFDSEGETLGRWRVSAFPTISVAKPSLVYGKVLVGDYLTNAVGELDPDTYDEYGVEMAAYVTSVPVHGDRRNIVVKRFEVDVESGVGLTTGQGSNPKIMLMWSRDGGHQWSNEYWRDLGKIGGYLRRAFWNQLGSGRQWVFQLRISDPVKRTIIAAHVELGGGAL